MLSPSIDSAVASAGSRGEESGISGETGLLTERSDVGVPDAACIEK